MELATRWPEGPWSGGVDLAGCLGRFPQLVVDGGVKAGSPLRESSIPTPSTSATLLPRGSLPAPRSFKTVFVERLPAIDGLDAITVAQRVLPSIILMDLMMPRMDGFEATRRLNADTRTSAIPVIAYTANALPNVRQVAQTAGCDDLLLKPRDLDMLADELRKRLTPSGYPRPFRVLVMDDESPIRTFTAPALAHAGYAVDAAASGLDDAFLEKPVSVTELQEAVSLLLFAHTLGPASNPCTAAVTRGISLVAPTDLPTDLRAPQQHSEPADTRSINIDL